VRPSVALLVLPLAVVGGAFTAGAKPAPASQFAPSTTYLADCGVCHRSRGEGTERGPRIAGKGRADVDYELTTGRMPLPNPTAKTERRAVRYTPTQIDALVDYVSAFGPGGVDIPTLPPGADESAGGELYRLQCAACHAWAGDGGALLHREAPGLHKATPTQVAEAVRVGPGTMPAFGTAALNDAQLAGVVRYVQYLKHPVDKGGLSLWHLGPVAEGAIAWIVGLGLLLIAIRWIGERE
jgi:quinol---cytochrome-c reductase cytochrome c subunit